MPIHARAPAAGKSQSASMRLLSGRCATSLRAHVHDLSPLWLGLSPPLSLTHGPFLSHVPPCCRRHCNGRVAALGQSLYPSIRSPLSLSTAQLPVPARDETSDQPTQQMPQLTDDNRATTRCPLLCAVALCAARRHSQLLRLPSARLPSARLPGPKCATCATACYKCQSTAKCDVPLCPSLCPSLPVCQSRA
jgi:hypothetical protein